MVEMLSKEAMVKMFDKNKGPYKNISYLNFVSIFDFFMFFYFLFAFYFM